MQHRIDHEKYMVLRCWLFVFSDYHNRPDILDSYIRDMKVMKSSYTNMHNVDNGEVDVSFRYYPIYI